MKQGKTSGLYRDSFHGSDRKNWSDRISSILQQATWRRGITKAPLKQRFFTCGQRKDFWGSTNSKMDWLDRNKILGPSAFYSMFYFFLREAQLFSGPEGVLRQKGGPQDVLNRKGSPQMF